MVASRSTGQDGELAKALHLRASAVARKSLGLGPARRMAGHTSASPYLAQV